MEQIINEEQKELSKEEQLEETIKQQKGTIDGLKALMGQLIPVVEVILPLLKERKEIDDNIVLQIEKVVEISKMLISMGEQVNGTSQSGNNTTNQTVEGTGASVSAG